jgi:hypothetical protein
MIEWKKAKFLFTSKWVIQEPFIEESAGIKKIAGHWWLMSITLAALEMEIGRTEVQGQSGQKSSQTPS